MKASLVRYFAAFGSGVIGALIPVLATGTLPNRSAIIASLGAGLLATGLFHCPSPAQGDLPSSESPKTGDAKHV